MSSEANSGAPDDDRDDVAPDPPVAEARDAHDGVDRPSRHRPRTALLYVQKLTKLYPSAQGLFRRTRLLQALGGVSFYLRRKETLGLVGESGSGKSTLGRCILRLTEPTVGRVVFDGQEVTALSSSELRRMRRRMQIVLQNPYGSLDPNMTLSETVGEGIDVFRLAASRKDREEQVAALLTAVGIDADLIDRYPHELSGGQRQRVAIARALAVKPEFLVLDEPTSGLDVSVQAQILNLLDDLQDQLGLAQLFISHDLRAVQYASHRIGVMYFGKLVELGPTDAVSKLQRHPYTRALFSALPKSEPGKRQLQLVDEPEAPSPFDPPRGCAFFPRCANAEPGRCDVEEPRLVECSGGGHHRVACWHPFED
jgi:oligopeptide transport system ATP-binding protein